MENIEELEVFRIETKDSKLVAHISYRDTSVLNSFEEVNNGYRSIVVPINLRDIQVSARGNYLVNQSVKHQVDVKSK